MPLTRAQAARAAEQQQRSAEWLQAYQASQRAQHTAIYHPQQTQFGTEAAQWRTDIASARDNWDALLPANGLRAVDVHADHPQYARHQQIAFNFQDWKFRQATAMGNAYMALGAR